MSNTRRCRSGQRYLAAITAAITAAVAALLAFSPASAAQQPPANPIAQEFKKYPGLPEAIARLVVQLQQDVRFPAPRTQSSLLPFLPDSTMSYAAFSNYGDVVQQVLGAFHAELRESAPFRDWWQHGSLASEGPNIEDALDKFAQLEQFLGDEIVFSGSLDGRSPNLLIVAQVRKPGLKKFLEQWITSVSAKSSPSIRVLDSQELAAVNSKGADQGDLTILVRQDFAAASLSLQELRNFNTRLEAHFPKFASTPFAQRILQEYRDGVTVLGAADLQKLMSQVPPSEKQSAAFQRSGFADVKYAVWDHKAVSDRSFSQAELSFSSPRRGAASWLANARPLHSLDFVSPEALIVVTVALANPERIFDDLKVLDGSPNPFPAINQFEQMLHLSLRDDFLAHLGGELTLELDSIKPPLPTWKALLSVKDTAPIERTLDRLLSAAGVRTVKADERGVTYHSLTIPYGQATLEVSYAVADGQLILASSCQAVTDAIEAHKSGASLAHSGKLQAALPPGYSTNASALLYQDPVVLAALQMRSIMPDLAESVAGAAGKLPPTVAFVYGEPASIREASTSPAMDVGAVLVVAAIAIPNLLRSKMAANEASAVGSIRTINTAQITYTSTYPQRGYAPDLATLGPDPREPTASSAHHAGLLDENLASESCAGSGWCTKSGYRFRVAAVCKKRACEDYVTVATPVDSNSGTRSFCSTSDAIIRLKPGTVDSPLTVAECKAWQPLQ
jgi:type IV pilus assembly protein PilA